MTQPLIPELIHPVNPPKSRLKIVLSVVLFLFLLASIPIGVYLTKEHQTIFPKANVSDAQAPETSLSLKEIDSTNSGILKVNILVRSDFDNINLSLVKITYPANLIELTEIATSSSKFKRWAAAGFDNTKAEATLIAGVENPGLKTTPQEEPEPLATLVFKVKQIGKAEIGFSDSTSLFRNSDNLNILQNKKGLTLGLINPPVFDREAQTESAGGSSIKTTPSVIQLKQISIKSPNGGEVLDYSKPNTLDFTASPGTQKLTFSLLLNGNYYGKIGELLENTSQISWTPSSSIPLALINNENTFQLLIEGISLNKEKISGISEGPFSISLSPVALSPSQSLDLKVSDFSLMMSQFNSKQPGSRVDLNGDGVVNQIDFWLLRKSLILNGTISLE